MFSIRIDKEKRKKILGNKFQQFFLNFSSLLENSCEYSTIMFIGTIEFLIRNIKSNWDKKKNTLLHQVNLLVSILVQHINVRC